MLRGAGVLMHISSLPGKFGIGTFGKEAYKFADFIKKAGMKYWQILPLGHTGFGDSPYQCFNVFAGNPYFIDFDILEESGLLKDIEYKNEDYGQNSEKVDYGKIYNSKYKVLKIAYENYKVDKPYEIELQFLQFKKKNSFWLEEYSLYMALKLHFDVGNWYNWDNDIKSRKPEAIIKYKTKLKDEIEYWSFIQYLFFSQWFELKKYVEVLGIEIIGDIPIYVAEDSVDTWSAPENFRLDKRTLEPTVVAGCPPDAFSDTGQLWGNLIYDWNLMKKTGYKWWISRIRESLKLYDVVRIDHFRGFESYWAIPYGNGTAVNGSWEKGPGIELFNAIKAELGDVNVIAEDLGNLTDEVRDFLKQTGFPGMKILQFAFDGSNDNCYLPHKYSPKCVAYTGSHDNDTLLGWCEKTASGNDIKNAKEYLGLNETEGYSWGLIRGVCASVADVSIAQMQDFIGAGNEARMNLPSSMGTNWSWRIKSDRLTDELANKMAGLNYRFER
ncbi:4-alpha-glucanotransferase [Clostridium vincentii]|uniref:4-alpha-glucanotransferase n=1 Tax=Clostridium vincentii TaxID=52704 RepID=A0A2T0BKP5_9CLOT|nr:4-alpha-glucanotransferase [Clostridium vincentii]PRR84372.1 4-alpha-glucanotransferase [Clostridium vincentii]